MLSQLLLIIYTIIYRYAARIKKKNKIYFMLRKGALICTSSALLEWQSHHVRYPGLAPRGNKKKTALPSLSQCFISNPIVLRPHHGLPYKCRGGMTLNNNVCCNTPRRIRTTCDSGSPRSVGVDLGSKGCGCPIVRFHCVIRPTQRLRQIKQKKN